MTRAMVLMAQGCEELEAVTVIDLFRRAGIDTTVTSLDGSPVKASRGVTLLCDSSLEEVKNTQFDVLVLPGGQPGTNNLIDDPRVTSLLREMAESGKVTAAICAAPKVLASAGLLKGKQVTCYPGTLDGIPDIKLKTTAVVQDGNIVTSRGPGTAMDFALYLIQLMEGQEKRDQVESGLVRS